ncbi:hypothetical protein [Pelagicoccus sp. SDUM812002]|uniref:hypothetical protein n=1 Tax=Pelagicoccus sp. SDUM812002 TaxID=3041266 RepID=UPI00280F7CA2|nr:hypothetical protein [Pelagicoccus sp. SDUM812002]MDQ8187300.1 hypothetical protein [Pelagicoccus sp. SDUM812002]
MTPKFKYANFAIAVIALLAGGIYLGTLLQPTPRPPEQANKGPDLSPKEVERIRSIPKPKAPSPPTTDKAATTSTRINALAQLNQPNNDPQTDIRIIEHLLEQVHTVFHELPTGEHDEIVAFLRGANPRGIQYIPDNDPNLNDDGKVIDRWGTPFFFHTLSRHRIEVRSAGPDQLHWSEDDVITESQATES